MAVKKQIRKWKPILLVKVYRMVLAGLSDVDICSALGFSRAIFGRWKKERPELAEAIAIARKERSDGEKFPAWVYSRLRPELREVWDQIRSLWHREDGVSKIEGLLADHGKQVKQELFLHALCVTRFNTSKSLRLLGMPKKELDLWVMQDVDFAELVQEMEFHKGNFFEDAMIRLVQEGVPAAVIAANRDYNAERGYGRKSKVDVSHSGQVMHGVFDLAEIMKYMKPEEVDMVMNAIRLYEKESEEKARKTIPGLEDVVRGRISESVQ